MVTPRFSSLHLHPVIVPKAWGSESWILSFQKGHVSPVADSDITLDQMVERDDFPLLLKIITANENLSVQVHPNNEMAQRLHGSDGKTEMWHVLKASPGAKIYAGLRKRLTLEEYDQRVTEGTIIDVMEAYDSHPGDTFLIPAGTLHAIGRGNVLCEVQQDSDITYRVFDYGRGRELHLTQAREAVNLDNTAPALVEPLSKQPCVSPFFTVSLGEQGDTNNLTAVVDLSSLEVTLYAPGCYPEGLDSASLVVQL